MNNYTKRHIAAMEAVDVRDEIEQYMEGADSKIPEKVQKFWDKNPGPESYSYPDGIIIWWMLYNEV